MATRMFSTRNGKIGRMGNSLEDPPLAEHCSTTDVAMLLGMAVRSVQVMVDRGEFEAWKTPGGHRRILRSSVDRWLSRRNQSDGVAVVAKSSRADDSASARVLLIEDSVHFQNLVGLLIRQQFPQIDFHVADDGLAGLALYGRLQPDVLIVDILLPGVDGPTLITTLRSHPQFASSHLIVVTSLDEAQRAPFAFALQGVTLIHKPRLVTELPVQLARCLAHERSPRPGAASNR